MSGYRTEIHVFHYATHSLVWQATTNPGSGCFTRGSHLHTPAGDDVLVTCDVLLTRDSAESRIADITADYVEYGDVLGAVHVFRHRDDAAPVAAAEITAAR